MPIAADPFAPPKAIGQGLTPIVGPDYGATPTTGQTSEGAQSAAAGPFGAGGALSAEADQAREGLAKLLQPQSGANGAEPSLASATGAIPISGLGLPQLGGSPVSTGGAAAISRPSSASGLGGIANAFSAGGSGFGAQGPAPTSSGLAASEGGRAFGPGSPLSGFGAQNAFMGLGLLGLLAGIPGLNMLGAPLTAARGVEGLANQLGFPANFTGFTPTGEELAGQQSNTGFFGFGQPSRGSNPVSLSDAARGVAPEGFSPSGVPTGSGAFASGAPAFGDEGNVGTGDTSGGSFGEGGTPFARGGLVPNLHSGVGDDEPIRATAGEFVIRAPAVQKLGLARLMRENRAA